MTIDRRMVLRHTTGRFAGLHKITGTFGQLGTSLPLSALPCRLANVDLIDHHGDAVLERVDERYVLYREADPTTDQPREDGDDGA